MSLRVVGNHAVSFNNCIKLRISATLVRSGLISGLSDGFCAFITKSEMYPVMSERPAS